MTGNEVVIGRTDGAIKVPSNAVSRQHVKITRDGDQIVIRHRNGAARGIRRINVARPARGEGIELKLGKEVPLRITPSRKIAGAVEIEVAGSTYFASLDRRRRP